MNGNKIRLGAAKPASDAGAVFMHIGGIVV